MREHSIKKEANILQNPLYGIVDYETCLSFNISIFDFAIAFFNGGGCTLQYRDKVSPPIFIEENFIKLSSIANKYNALLILNDHSGIAQKYKASFHVGQEDILQSKITHDDIWGCSTHTINEITNILKMDVVPHYIGYGAIFSSYTKNNVPVVDTLTLSSMINLWNSYFILIGGITLHNVMNVPKGNKIGYAIIRDFFSIGNKPRDIEQYTQSFIKLVSS